MVTIIEVPGFLIVTKISMIFTKKVFLLHIITSITWVTSLSAASISGYEYYRNGFLNVDQMEGFASELVCYERVSAKSCLEKSAFLLVNFHIEKNNKHYEKIQEDLKKEHTGKNDIEIQRMIMSNIYSSLLKNGNLPNVNEKSD